MAKRIKNWLTGLNAMSDRIEIIPRFSIDASKFRRIWCTTHALWASYTFHGNLIANKHKINVTKSLLRMLGFFVINGI